MSVHTQMFVYRYTICTVCVCVCVPVCVCVYSLSHSLNHIHMQIATIGPTTSEDMQQSGLTVSVSRLLPSWLDYRKQ